MPYSLLRWIKFKFPLKEKLRVVAEEELFPGGAVLTLSFKEHSFLFLNIHKNTLRMVNTPILKQLFPVSGHFPSVHWRTFALSSRRIQHCWSIYMSENKSPLTANDSFEVSNQASEFEIKPLRHLNTASLSWCNASHLIRHCSCCGSTHILADSSTYRLG